MNLPAYGATANSTSPWYDFFQNIVWKGFDYLRTVSTNDAQTAQSQANAQTSSNTIKALGTAALMIGGVLAALALLRAGRV